MKRSGPSHCPSSVPVLDLTHQTVPVPAVELGRVGLAVPVEVRGADIVKAVRAQPLPIPQAGGGFQPPADAGGGIKLDRIGLAVAIIVIPDLLGGSIRAVHVDQLDATAGAQVAGVLFIGGVVPMLVDTQAGHAEAVILRVIEGAGWRVVSQGHLVQVVLDALSGKDLGWPLLAEKVERHRVNGDLIHREEETSSASCC